jgi:hypothetical protein
MTRRFLVGLAVAVAAATLVACSSSSSSQPSSPSATSAASSPTVTVDAFVGQWADTTSTGVSSDTGQAENTAVTLVPNGVCSLIEFKVDRSTDSSSAVIAFAATCANARLRGLGTGQVSGGTLYWKAEGVLSLASGRTCQFKFVEGNRAAPAGEGFVKVSYNGTVCDIPVSGTQIVKRK